tara:strand:- start:635 stop:874 length:240 start_codon:yes stop_codon:yes gene_type:complete
MPPNKGPNIIRYCVITSTLSLIVIALGQIPQFKVHKAKLLCAEYISHENSIKRLNEEDKIKKKFIGNSNANVIDYCNSL